MCNFENFFKIDKPIDLGKRIVTGTGLFGDSALEEFMSKFAGASFNNGLYRVLNAHEINRTVEMIEFAFPGYADGIIPFAFDWLNRKFCLDIRDPSVKGLQCLIFSHLSNEVLQIPSGVSDFHQKILVDHVDEILDIALFKELLNAKGRSSIINSECASLRQPLFLNGAFTVKNMDLIDIDVDWEITGEMLLRSRKAKLGERINSVYL